MPRGRKPPDGSWICGGRTYLKRVVAEPDINLSVVERSFEILRLGTHNS